MTWYRHVIDRITVTWSFFYLTAQLEVGNNEQRTSHRLLQEAPGEIGTRGCEGLERGVLLDDKRLG